MNNYNGIMQVIRTARENQAALTRATNAELEDTWTRREANRAIYTIDCLCEVLKSSAELIKVQQVVVEAAEKLIKG